MLTLRPHQLKTVKEAPNKWGLWFRMRVGKTPTAIRLAAERATSCLIICPKSLKMQWINEIAKWSAGSSTEFVVYSKEEFVKNHKTAMSYDAIIIDEVHRAFSNFRNQTYKALDAYKKRVHPQFIWILTGTPYTSSPWSVYTYGLILDKQWKWNQWNKHFFYQIKIGNRLIPQARKDRDADLQKAIKMLGTVIDLKDVADVPDDEDIIETFEIEKEQKEWIKESFDPLPIVEYSKRHQIEQGVLNGDEFTESRTIICEKDDRIIELAESSKKIIFVARYHLQIEKIVQMLEPLKRPIFQIHGKIKQTASEVAMEAERSDNGIVVIQSGTSEGYSLKSYDIMVFTSMDYSFVNYDQMRYRMKDATKKDGCTYIHMITEGESIDRSVFDAVSKKQDFSIELYAKTQKALGRQ